VFQKQRPAADALYALSARPNPAWKGVCTPICTAASCIFPCTDAFFRANSYIARDFVQTPSLLTAVREETGGPIAAEAVWGESSPERGVA
jgi:hypothetical protein